MIAIGAAFLVLCIFLPADERRLVMVGLGVPIVAVGIWNLLNAQRIFDVANAKDYPPM